MATFDLPALNVICADKAHQTLFNSGMCLQVKSMESETPGINESLRSAKLLLKKSKRVDYYKLLEISQDANDYDIKKVCALRGICSASHMPEHVGSLQQQGSLMHVGRRV